MNTHMRFLTIDAGISSKLYYDLMNEITGRFTNVVSFLKTRRLRETRIKKREKINQWKIAGVERERGKLRKPWKKGKTN